MYQLFETIKCKDGVLYNLQFHQARFDKSRNYFHGCSESMTLRDIIQIPEKFTNGLYRCRITYSSRIEIIEFVPHNSRKIDKLRLVFNNEIEYGYKFSNREILNKLFEKRGECDDVIIIKNGFVTDSSTANLIFFDGNKWWTPNTSLLQGTQRERLLKEGEIFECCITSETIFGYKKVGLINAMWDMDNMPLIKTQEIYL